MNFKILAAAAAMMMTSGWLFAQPQGGDGKGRPMPPKRETPEQKAQKITDCMKKEVNLTDKQYKKVYKLFKKDFEQREKEMSKNMGGPGMPPGGGPGMPPGGGPGMGGPGMPPPGGSGMGAPSGGPGYGNPGERPQDMGQCPPPQGQGCGVSDEYLEKQDAKLKKILTDEQYTKWREKHVPEHLQMPDPELKAPDQQQQLNDIPPVQ